MYLLKFIYSEKATKFCEISTLLLSYAVPVKSKAEILWPFQNIWTLCTRHIFSTTCESTALCSVIKWNWILKNCHFSYLSDCLIFAGIMSMVMSLKMGWGPTASNINRLTRKSTTYNFTKIVLNISFNFDKKPCEIAWLKKL